jgi:NADH:ubiquinone oxidoreductase subunit H
MNDEIRTLLVAAENAVEKSVKYSKTAFSISWLWCVLSVLSVAAAVAYFLLGGWHLAAAGASLAVASLVADRLYYRYYRAALEEAYKLDRLVHMAALVYRLDQLMAETEKEIEEMEQILKKASAD